MWLNLSVLMISAVSAWAGYTEAYAFGLGAFLGLNVSWLRRSDPHSRKADQDG